MCKTKVTSGNNLVFYVSKQLILKSVVTLNSSFDFTYSMFVLLYSMHFQSVFSLHLIVVVLTGHFFLGSFLSSKSFLGVGSSHDLVLAHLMTHV